MKEPNLKPCYIGIDRTGMVVALAGCVPNNGYDAREIAEALIEMADSGLRVELTTVADGAARLYKDATAKPDCHVAGSGERP